jgi:hypothetical protein
MFGSKMGGSHGLLRSAASQMHGAPRCTSVPTNKRRGMVDSRYVLLFATYGCDRFSRAALILEGVILATQNLGISGKISRHLHDRLTCPDSSDHG